MDTVLKLSNISKSYNHNLVLDDVSVTLERGGIYGYIGQNGAGKTTLIRLITGLSFPDSGSMEIFGQTGQKGLEMGRRRIGCMVEHAGLYSNLTALENLQLHCKLKDIPEQQISSVLKIVGLEDTGKKKFKNFSMGMKQRLGIAAALIGNPELLILDEPVNGLDPLGIVEIREMLVKLNHEHKITILISSHLLSELYMLATDYIIIEKGRIVETLTLDQLNEQCKKHIVIETDDIQLAEIVLDNIHVKDYIKIGEGRIKILDQVPRETLARAFHEARLILTELSSSGKSLESFFIELIGGK